MLILHCSRHSATQQGDVAVNCCQNLSSLAGDDSTKHIDPGRNRERMKHASVAVSVAAVDLCTSWARLKGCLMMRF